MCCVWVWVGACECVRVCEGVFWRRRHNVLPIEREMNDRAKMIVRENERGVKNGISGLIKRVIKDVLGMREREKARDEDRLCVCVFVSGWVRGWVIFPVCLKEREKENVLMHHYTMIGQTQKREWHLKCFKLIS